MLDNDCYQPGYNDGGDPADPFIHYLCERPGNHDGPHGAFMLSPAIEAGTGEDNYEITWPVTEGLAN
jgi:hypothetical protein